MNQAVEYRKLQVGEEIFLSQLLQIFASEFEKENFTLPSEAYEKNFLSNNQISVYVAIQEGRVVGGMTVHLLPSVYGEYVEAYIYDLAVDASEQRKGIGTGLLHFLKKDLGGSKVKEIFVQADVEDEGALAFYRKTGGEERDVRHFTYLL